MITVRWCFNTRNFVNSLQNWKQCLSSIQSEEVQRLSEFVHKNSVVSSLIGRLMLRKWANQHLGIQWQHANFGRSDRGRPYLIREENQCLNKFGKCTDVNVSHQGDWVVLAASEGGVVGVDVMKTTYSGGKPTQDFFRLMKRQFTREEWDSIRTEGWDERQQLEGFYRHWCLKESVVKALGVGITLSLQRVSFDVGPKPVLGDCTPVTNTTVTIDKSLSDKWVFEESFLSEDYCACIAFLPVDNTCDLDLVADRMILLEASNATLYDMSFDDDKQKQSFGVLSNSLEGASVSLRLFKELTLEQLLEGSQTMTCIPEDMVLKFYEKPTVPWL